MGEGGNGSEYGAGHVAFEGSKGHESTPAKAKFKYAMRDLFPNMPIAGWTGGYDNKLVEEWAWLLAPKNANEQGLKTKQISYSQEKYGRSDFIPLIFKAFDGTTFSVMYRRGVGGADESAGDFNSPNWKDKSDMGNAGLADTVGTLREAEKNAIELHKLGIRTRLPIMGFEIESVWTVDGEKTIEELVREGSLSSAYLINKPVESYWARRNPGTLSDAMQSENLDGLIVDQARLLRLEGNKYSRHVAERIESGKGKNDWFNWLVDMSSSQMAKWAEVGFMHPVFHGQNITLSIETGDLGDVENQELRKLTSDSSEDDKRKFVDQTVKMLEMICDLKGRSDHGGRILNEGESGVDEKLVNRYVTALAKTRNGLEILDAIRTTEIVRDGLISETEALMRKSIDRPIVRIAMALKKYV